MVIVLNSAAPPHVAGPVSAPGLALIGVGPGNPDWLTLAAHQALQQAEVVAYPVARRDATGMAATIVERFLLPEQQRLPLVFPMVRAMEALRPAWIAAADALAAAVTAGRRVVFLCEGDVSLFATGSYVLLALRQHHPDCPVRLIPGVSSVAAAAAQGNGEPLKLFESGAILLHLAERHSNDIRSEAERALTAQWLLFANATLAIALFVPSNREREFARLMAELDRMLDLQTPLVGEQWGAADCAVQAYLAYLPVFFPELDLSPYPTIQALIASVQQRPAYRKAMGLPA